MLRQMCMNEEKLSKVNKTNLDIIHKTYNIDKQKNNKK